MACRHLQRDHELLGGLGDQHIDPRAIGLNLRGGAVCADRRWRCGHHPASGPGNASPSQMRPPHGSGVLANAAGEDTRASKPPHRRRVRADIFAGAVRIDVDRQLGRRRRRRPRGPRPRACRRYRPAPAARCRGKARPRRAARSDPIWRCKKPNRPGSTSPERVPMTSPSSGVSPMELSTERPSCDGRRRWPRLPRCRLTKPQHRARGSAMRHAARTRRDVFMRGAVKPVAPQPARRATPLGTA